MTNGRGRPVARVDNCVSGKGQQFAANAFEKQRAIAVREVRSADAFAEEHIAAENHDRPTAVHEDDVSRRMARHIQNLQTNSGELDDVAAELNTALRAGLAEGTGPAAGTP